jgi:hypothetical protein
MFQSNCAILASITEPTKQTSLAGRKGLRKINAHR